MPSTDIERAPRSASVAVAGPAVEILEVWRGYYEIAEAICRTDFVPKALKNNPAAVAAAMLTGRELGLPEMAALSLIYVFDGRPGIYAEGMRALVQSHGHEVWVDDNEYTASKVTLYGQRAGSNKVAKVSWTMDMAKAANLANKDTYRKHPRQMLLARATGELCRLMFADVLRGVSYTVEELEDGFVDEEPAAGELGSGDQPKTTHTRKAAPTKKAAAKRAAPPAASGPPVEPPQPPLPGEDESDIPAKSSSGDVTPDEPAGSDADDFQTKERSKSIAIACQRAGLDDDGRHRLIEVVTNGRVVSSKDVTAEEGAEVLQAAHDITAGRLTLIDGDDGWALIAIEDATGDEPEADEVKPEPEAAEPSTDWGDEDRWTSDQWRQFLKQRGVTVTATVRAAQNLAAEFDIKPPPASLDHLHGKTDLCRLVRGWVEDQADGGS